MERNCDICWLTAYWDAKTSMGPWAYMCDECFNKYAVQKHLALILADITE